MDLKEKWVWTWFIRLRPLYRDKCRALVNTKMQLRVTQSLGNFLTGDELYSTELASY